MTKTWKMLWAEDESIHAAVLPLVKKGWEIVICNCFDAASRRIVSDEYFDVFLIDIKLPRWEADDDEHECNGNDTVYLGLDLIELIRKHRESALIAVFSVVYDPLVDQRLKDLGVQVRFHKGVATVVEGLERLVNRGDGGASPDGMK